MNLNGALNVQTKEAVVLDAPTVSAVAMIELFKALEAKHPDARTIHLICDNAKYNHARIVREYEETSRINSLTAALRSQPQSHRTIVEILSRKNALQRVLRHLPRVQNRFLDFFKDMRQYRDELDSLLTENFHITGERIAVSQS